MAANDLATPSDPHPNARHIRRLQVGLRALHYGVVLAGILLAVGEAIGLMGTLGLVVLMLLVVMHVLGNALGTRINRESGWSIDDEPLDPALLSLPHDWRSHLATQKIKHLGSHTSGGWLVGGMTCLGMIAGGISGGLFFAQEPTWAGMIVGTVSAVILGGFFGFMTSSCSKVVLAAWWQAKAEANPQRRPA